MMSLIRRVAILSAVLALAVPALAVDYWGGPPDGTWNRGDPGSTWQNWHLCVSALPDTPDEGDNLYGIPTFDIVEGTFEWANDWECPPELGGFGTDGWHCTSPTGGVVKVTIPNTPNPLEIKYMFVQITSSKVPSAVTPVGQGPDIYVPGTFPTGRTQIQWGTPAPYGGSWYTYNYGLTLQPNPESETILIAVPYCTVIDEIVVDTICTPEPTALAIIGLGAVAMLRRRRR